MCIFRYATRSIEELLELVSNTKEANDYFEHHCPVVARCDDTTPFRTIDGNCNNLRNPTDGQAERTLIRLMASRYDDGNHLDISICIILAKTDMSIFLQECGP